MHSSHLELINVHKSYGNVDVLQGLSLVVQPGEVFGFLGKNGAGKSTAIRAIMGIIQIDSGEIRLFNEVLRPNSIALRQRVGYVAQEQNFYHWMTPQQLGKFTSGFYPRWNEHRYASLLQHFALPAKRKLGTFSGGMKAKLALALALSCQPQLLILDEPTAGMDPIARREFSHLVQEQVEQTEAAIFFSTHLIDEIESVATRIGIVEQGKAIYTGELEALTQRIAMYCVADDSVDAQLPYSLLAPAAERCLQDRSMQRKRHLVLQFPVGIIPAIIPGTQWQQQSMTLEDVFIALVGGSTA